MCIVCWWGVLFLTASPDGLIVKGCLVEVNCLGITVDLTPHEDIEEKLGEMGKMWKRRISEDTLEIKKMHMYHFQVQGQLHVTKWICLFTIRTPKGLREEKIYLEITNFGRKLEKFYLECLLPEKIIDSRRSVQIGCSVGGTDVVLAKVLNV